MVDLSERFGHLGSSGTVASPISQANVSRITEEWRNRGRQGIRTVSPQTNPDRILTAADYSFGAGVSDTYLSPGDALAIADYILGVGNDQQDDGFTQLSDADESLTGQSNIKLRMLGGNDFLEVTGGRNYANGNMGEDTIILRGGFGEYLGGKDSDTIEVFGAEARTSVNGNLGEDFITGTVAGVTYRGGKDNDLLAVSQGDVMGDRGADTFRALAGDGFAVVQDYTIGEDMVDIEMDGSWSNVENGLMFTDGKGDQRMLLLGINDVEKVTMV